MIQALRAWWSRRMSRPFFHDDRTQFVVLALFVICVVGIIAVPHAAAADVWGSVKTAVLTLIGWILQVILKILSSLVVFFVDILIWVAQYNDFLKSQAVTTGWPLVRDVVNMFFIVVLLLSAFSTIIGWKEFHYSTVLPKLLLMAILINFSKTIVGLMIDFSQVVMLTFVYAFRNAAGGNFITAFHLDEVTKLTATGERSLDSLVAALLLGVILLTVAFSCILIMTVFLAVRVVYIWILIILSPIAFFTYALPGKLKNAVSVFSGKYWGDLSKFLIAGPVMAFFLWLTLAIAQGPSPFGDTFPNQDEVNNAATAAQFSNEVGKPANIGTFVVAIIMLLSGVKFGIETSSALHPALGSFAEKYLSPKALAKFQGVRRAGQLSYKYAIKPVGKGVKLVGKGVLKGANLVSGGKAGAGLAGMQQKIGAGMTSKFGAGSALGKAGAKFGAAPGVKVGAAKKGMVEAYGGLSAVARQKRLNVDAKSTDYATSTAAKQMLAESSMNGLDRKAQKQIELEKLANRSDLTKDQKESLAGNLARENRKKHFKDYMENEVDEEKRERFKDRMDKSGERANITDFRDVRDMDVDKTNEKDISRALATFKENAFQSSESVNAMLHAIGAEGKDGTIDKGSEAWKLLERKGGSRFEHINAIVKAQTDEQRALELSAMDGDPAAIKKAEEDRVGSERTSTGKYIAMQVKMGDQNFAVTTNQNIVNKAMEGLAGVAKRGGKANEDDAVAFKAMAMGGGAPLQQAVRFDTATSTFDNKEEREGFQMALSNMVTQAADTSDFAEAVSALANLDTASMKDDPNGHNEARIAGVTAADLEKLMAAYGNAAKEQNTQAQTKVQEILQMVTAEGRKAEAFMQQAGFTLQDMEAIVDQEPGYEKIVERMVQVPGVGDAAGAVDIANAAFKKQQIDMDPSMMAVRGSVSDVAYAKAAAVEGKLFEAAETAAVKVVDAAGRATEAARSASDKTIGRFTGNTRDRERRRSAPKSDV